MKDLNREVFFKIEKILLCIYCLMFFIRYDISKELLAPMLLIILIRKFKFKEKLECGSEIAKKFLLFFLIGGCIWNFMPEFDYRASRAFFKISREMILPFYIFPMYKKDKNLLKMILMPLAASFILMSGKVFHYSWVNPGKVAFGFEWISITRAMALFTSCFSLGWVFEKNSVKLKIVSCIALAISVMILMLSQSRAGFVALAVVLALEIFIRKFSLKKLLAVTFIAIFIFLAAPTKIVEKMETAFNTEKTVSNASNYQRIEMWKNTTWRIKQHPIMGSGTKQDGKLFKEYVKNMPEETEMDRHFKKVFQNSKFNDAHNMYLNIISDNGIFSFVHAFLFFIFLPNLLYRNLSQKDNFLRSMNLGIGLSFVGFYIYGSFWSIWRGDWTRMEFWFLVALLLCITYGNTDEKHRIG